MKVHILQEPEIQFASGRHIDIRAGLATHGAFDRGQGSVSSPIALGVVGTSETTEAVQQWIASCRAGVASLEEKLRELRPDYPGVSDAVFGTHFATSSGNTRAVSKNELRKALGGEDSLDALVELFLDHARDIAEKSRVDVMLIVPPWEVFELGDRPTLREGAKKSENGAIDTRNFHDMFKARALDLPAPCQLLRPDTYNADLKLPRGMQKRTLQSAAIRAWNFHAAIYYKAGGVPWRLIRDSEDLSTCYVGASFYNAIDGGSMKTSVAQVFNERGEGMVVRGGNARINKGDKTAHLSAEDARMLLSSALASYRREHKTMPARIVVHKTSYFDDAEREGCRRAADEANVEFLDLVSIRWGRTRLLASRTSPVSRGTALTFDDQRGLVYLKGAVPYFKIYPGMYVPRPIEFLRDEGETPPIEIAREILKLSKLNFNNTQFDCGEPITIRAARCVSEILKNVDSTASIRSGFRYFT